MPLLRAMQSVALEVPEGAQAGTYPTLVLRLAEGEEIVVGAPLERGREVRLEAESAVHLQLPQPDGVYVLRTRVVERSADQPSLRLAWPDGSELVQRRNHPRVETELRCTLRLQGRGGSPTLEAETRNLSSGGVLLAAPEPVEVDAQAQLTLHLPEVGERGSEARVLRCDEDPDAPPAQRYRIALGFVGILDSVRDDLTRFVFEAERRKRRAGA